MGSMNAVRYHAEEEDTPTTAVVAAVATHFETSMLELPTLYESINADALDSLFHSWNETTSSHRITFSYADCEITVFSSGVVEVETPD